MGIGLKFPEPALAISGSVYYVFLVIISDANSLDYWLVGLLVGLLQEETV
jgi:hypothetical protein